MAPCTATTGRAIAHDTMHMHARAGASLFALKITRTPARLMRITSRSETAELAASRAAASSPASPASALGAR